MSTLMTFVEPGMLTAVPAVMTTRSPTSRRPAWRAAWIEVFQRSSMSLHSLIWIGVTPHSSAIWRIAQSTCVSAMIGRWGRSRATLEAVLPLNVGTRIAFARSASATSHAAFDIALPIVGFCDAWGVSWRYPALGSIAHAILSMYA